MTIKTAVAGDAPEIVVLVRSAYRGVESRDGWTSEADLVGGDRIDEAGVLALITTPGSMMLIAREDDGVVACCQLQDQGGNVTYFGTFAVDPRRQGAGLGRQLMAAAEHAAVDVFAARQMEMTVLAQQGALIAHYERKGFVRTGEVRPFPADPVLARPLREDLYFVVLRKTLVPTPPPSE